MGRAIVRKPQVFLMDEPLSNLDAKLRVQMRADIAHLQKDLGTTTIYVTHDQVEAMTMGDRVAVMSKGVLQQVDAPQRLYDRPQNLFVAGFIGTPPMNLLECTVSVNGGVSIDLGGNRLPIADQALADYPGVRALRRQEGDRRAPRRRPASGAGARRPADDHGAGAARRVARRRVDGVLQGQRPQPEERRRPRRRRSSSPTRERDGRRRHGRTSSRRSRRTSSSSSATDVPVAVDTKNLHFFDEASGAPLR